MGLFVVFVARKRAVSLYRVSRSTTKKGEVARNEYGHDVFGMPVHDSIFEVEPFEIGYSGCLDLFWKTKKRADLNELGEVVLDEEVLLVRAEKSNTR
jgi:hypothetical protein